MTFGPYHQYYARSGQKGKHGQNYKSCKMHIFYILYPQKQAKTGQIPGEYEISGFKVLEQKLLKISRKKLYVHVLYNNLHRTNPKLGF